MDTQTATDATLAPTIDALHEAWGEAAKVAADNGITLPPVIITVQRSRKSWGHISTVPTWQADGDGRLEVMVSGENLARGARDVFGTVLHEAAHGANIARGIKDCDQNQRHNKRYKEAAEMFGLTVEQMGRYGYAKTTVTDDTAERHAAIIATLDAAIKAAAITGPMGKAVPTRDKNNPSAQCECGKKVRASREVLASGITCNECGTRFEVRS